MIPAAWSRQFGPPAVRVAALIATAAVAAALLAAYVRFTVRRYRARSRELIENYLRGLEKEAREGIAAARRRAGRGDHAGAREKLVKTVLRFLGKKYSLGTVPGDNLAETADRLQESLPPETAAPVRGFLSVMAASASDGAGEDDFLELARAAERILNSEHREER